MCLIGSVTILPNPAPNCIQDLWQKGCVFCMSVWVHCFILFWLISIYSWLSLSRSLSLSRPPLLWILGKKLIFAQSFSSTRTWEYHVSFKKNARFILHRGASQTSTFQRLRPNHRCHKADISLRSATPQQKWHCNYRPRIQHLQLCG